MDAHGDVHSAKILWLRRVHAVNGGGPPLDDHAAFGCQMACRVAASPDQEAGPCGILMRLFVMCQCWVGCSGQHWMVWAWPPSCLLGAKTLGCWH